MQSLSSPSRAVQTASRVNDTHHLCKINAGAKSVRFSKKEKKKNSAFKLQFLFPSPLKKKKRKKLSPPSLLFGMRGGYVEKEKERKESLEMLRFTITDEKKNFNAKS